MYIEVTLVIKITDYLSRPNSPFTLQKYTETWDVEDYQLKYHSIPVVEKVIGVINDEEVSLSVLIVAEDITEDIESEKIIKLSRSVYKEAFKKGKNLIKEHLDNSIITRF
jgi:hypothetical protein